MREFKKYAGVQKKTNGDWHAKLTFKTLWANRQQSHTIEATAPADLSEAEAKVKIEASLDKEALAKYVAQPYYKCKPAFRSFVKEVLFNKELDYLGMCEILNSEYPLCSPVLSGYLMTSKNDTYIATLYTDRENKKTRSKYNLSSIAEARKMLVQNYIVFLRDDKSKSAEDICALLEEELTSKDLFSILGEPGLSGDSKPLVEKLCSDLPVFTPRRKNTKKSSPYRGVIREKGGRYNAQLHVKFLGHEDRHSLGSFDSEKEAAKAVDHALVHFAHSKGIDFARIKSKLNIKLLEERDYGGQELSYFRETPYDIKRKIPPHLPTGIFCDRDSTYGYKISLNGTSHKQPDGAAVNYLSKRGFVTQSSAEKARDLAVMYLFSDFLHEDNLKTKLIYPGEVGSRSYQEAKAKSPYPTRKEKSLQDVHGVCLLRGASRAGRYLVNAISINLQNLPRREQEVVKIWNRQERYESLPPAITGADLLTRRYYKHCSEFRQSKIIIAQQALIKKINRPSSDEIMIAKSLGAKEIGVREWRAYLGASIQVIQDIHQEADGKWNAVYNLVLGNPDRKDSETHQVTIKSRDRNKIKLKFNKWAACKVLEIKRMLGDRLDISAKEFSEAVLFDSPQFIMEHAGSPLEEQLQLCLGIREAELIAEQAGENETESEAENDDGFIDPETGEPRAQRARRDVSSSGYTSVESAGSFTFFSASSDLEDGQPASQAMGHPAPS